LDHILKRYVKTKFFLKTKLKVKARIAKIAKKFDGHTQKIRGELILDLKALAEQALDNAAHKGATPKNKQKWTQPAAYISNTINRIAKEYDDKKILEELEELKKMAINLESEKGA
jgi:hypothetical protein